MRVSTVLVVLALAFGAFALVGCGGTKESPGGPSGTGLPESVKYVDEGVRKAAFEALKAAGYTFDENMVSVVAGGAGVIVAKGPLADAKQVKFGEASLAKGKDGKWAVTAVK